MKKKAAAVLASEAAIVLEAYSAGVNAWIDRVGRDRLPIEFEILEYEPEPWEPADSLAILRYFWWTLTGRLSQLVAAERLLGVNTADGFEPGLLEQAAGGTLFISEMTDAGSIAQKLLVSAVGSGEIARPGSNRIIGVDVRIIGSLRPGAHVNHSDGEFRTDLLAALGVLQLRVPALREYREDIPQLLRQYAEALLDTEDLNYRRFSVAAQNRLRNYPWPGNISELKNLVQRLLAAGGPEEISLAELESQLLSTALKNEPLVKQDLLAMPLREAREHFERAYLRQQLELCNGKVGQLAKRVGMERTHLYRKLRSLSINSWRSIN